MCLNAFVPGAALRAVVLAEQAPYGEACWRYCVPVDTHGLLARGYLPENRGKPVQLGEAGPKSTILVNRDGFPPT